MNTSEEQIALALAAKNGDGDALDRLIEGNLPFLWSLASKYPHVDAGDFKDLVQEGARGMMHAVEQFSPTKGATFLNYSAHWVRYRMRRWLHDQRPIKLPVRWHGDASAISEMDTESGFPLTSSDVQKEFGVGRVQAKRMRLAAAEIVSLSGDLLADLIPDSSQDVRETVAMADDIRSLEHALLTLTPRQRECVQRYYGLAGFNRQTLAEVGAHVGLGGERVRTLLLEALRKLRRQVKQ
jgi:RNA polymerase sigma factor (sigma-70 family)